MNKSLKAISLALLMLALTGCYGLGGAVKLKRETGRSFLVKDLAEGKGYGLYSYLLFGSPPTDATRNRYLKAIEAYLLFPDIGELGRYLERHELNITYLPVDAPPPLKVSPEFVLEHYNYARARKLLRAFPGNYRDGPYIVSSLKPLGSIEILSGQYLYQNLSIVPPHLVSSWVKEFLNQAEQERFWEERTAEQLALKIRTAIAILAEGLPDVQKALKTWIVWIK